MGTSIYEVLKCGTVLDLFPIHYAPLPVLLRFAILVFKNIPGLSSTIANVMSLAPSLAAIEADEWMIVRRSSVVRLAEREEEKEEDR